jgi:Uri superfamily endonuclease
MKGIYCLVLHLPNDIDAEVGALGTISLEKGWWVYVGSARGTGSTSLEHRLRRHFSRKKRIHWHIDYLLESSPSIDCAIYASSEEPLECELAQTLVQTKDYEWGHRRFGASDCTNSCGSHLLRFAKSVSPKSSIYISLRKLGLEPREYEKAT